MKTAESEFCMRHFKVAILTLMILIVMIIGWSAWHCGSGPRREFEVALAAAATPTAPPVDVNAKMLHPYWGNCEKCHVTTGAGKPVSQVMAGPPISVATKMTHDYWGNCKLCHKITDGVQPGNNPAGGAAVAAAFDKLNSQSLGLKAMTVTASMKQQYNLISEDGVLVVEVQPNSIASQAGLQSGDEILRVNKTRVESVNSLDAAIADLKPGNDVPLAIYRGRNRNLFLKIPKSFPAASLSPNGGAPNLSTPAVSPAAAAMPLTQNQVETLAEQLGVPKTMQAVTQALQKNKPSSGTQAPAAPAMTQNQVETMAEQLGVPKTQQSVTQALQSQNRNNTRLAATPQYCGKMAVASTGPGLSDAIAPRFESAPYFIIFDSGRGSYSSVRNPNTRMVAGQDALTGQYMVDLGATDVIAGTFGPNALNTLSALQVNVYPGVTGTVRGGLSALAAGELNPVNAGSGMLPGARTRVPAGNGALQPGIGPGANSVSPGVQINGPVLAAAGGG